MSISNSNTQQKDIIFIQRDDSDEFYGETHISGSDLIFYTDSDGYINADKSASFYSIFPPPDTAGLIPGNTYPITASWAESSSWASMSLSASWAPGGFTTGDTLLITASWAESASWAPSSTTSNSSSWASSSIISETSSFSNYSLASDFALLAGVSISSSYALSASWAPSSDSLTSNSSSWASSSIISETASLANYAVASDFALLSGVSISSSYSETASIAISASWSSQSLSSSYPWNYGSSTFTFEKVGINISQPSVELHVSGTISGSDFYGRSALIGHGEPTGSFQGGYVYIGQNNAIGAVIGRNNQGGTSWYILDSDELRILNLRDQRIAFYTSASSDVSGTLKATIHDDIVFYTPLLFSGSNTFDIGTSTNYKPRTIYVGTSVVSPSFSGSLFGTSSIAISASWAPESGTTGSGVIAGGSYDISASWASSSLSSSYALTASYISGSILFSGNANYNFPMWINNELSQTSSLVYTGSSLYLDGGSGSIIATSSWAISASWAPSISSTTSISSSWASSSLISISSSWASSSLSSSFAYVSISSSWAPSGGTGVTPGGSYDISASWASSSLSSSTSNYSINAETASSSLTSSYFYKTSGSGAWRIYVEPTYGDLVFDFF